MKDFNGLTEKEQETLKKVQEELKKIPFEGLSRLLAELSLFRLKADQDPNYESQSRTEK